MRRNNVLVIDAVVAALIAVAVLIVTPGLAIAAFIAFFVVLVCMISLVLDLRRRRPGKARPPRVRR